MSQHDRGRQDADLRDVRDVRDDDRLGEPHHPEIIKTFRRGADCSQDVSIATMAGIAWPACVWELPIAGAAPGGVIGLTVFAAASFLFAAGKSFLLHRAV